MDPVGRSLKPAPTARAAWIRYVREEVAHMKQDAFADAIGVARPTVSNWERGVYEPGWEHLDAIMQAFPEARPPVGEQGDGVQQTRLTFASLHQAIEEWCRAAGEPELIDDDEFVEGLLKLFMGYKRRRRAV